MSAEFESAVRLAAMKSGIEAKTGGTYTDLTAGVQALVDGYGVGSAPVLTNLEITENGEYTPPDGVDGFGKVVANVAGSGGAFDPLSYVTKFEPNFAETTGYPDPFVLNLPRCTTLSTVFNANTLNCKTLEFYLPNQAIAVSSLCGAGGFKTGGVKNIKIRCGESRTLTLKNTTTNYLANGREIETLDFILDLSLFKRVNTNMWFNAALKNVEFAPNSIYGYAYTFFQNTPNLSDDTIISVCNALRADSVSTFTLEATPKARCEEILGTVSQVTDEGGVTYDFFTADSAGTITLTEFITVTKGWTLA